MYRLLLPEILKEVDKCIYLDSDLIVEGDISELYRIEMDGKCIAGVKAGLELATDQFKKERLNELKIPSLDDYINAGVLVFDLKNIRAMNLNQKLKAAGYNGYRYNDQDAINAVMYSEIKHLPLKYNMSRHWAISNDPEYYEYFGKRKYCEAKKSPVIIHYLGKYKPWIYKNTYKAKRWWDYVEMQDDLFKCEYLPSFLKNLPERREAPSIESIIDFCKDLMRRMGIYFRVRRLFLKS